MLSRLESAVKFTLYLNVLVGKEQLGLLKLPPFERAHQVFPLLKLTSIFTPFTDSIQTVLKDEIGSAGLILIDSKFPLTLGPPVAIEKISAAFSVLFQQVHLSTE